MKPLLKKIGFVAKYLFLIYAVFLAAFFSIFFIIENRSVNSELNELKLNQERAVQKSEEFFVIFFERAVSDLKYLSKSFSFPQEGIEEKWEAILESNGTYNKIRYIDLDGNEVLRLDYFRDNAFLIDSSSFSNVQDETYFKKTIELEEGQIHISGINIVENKDYPEELSIMLCTPVYNGEMTGILALDCNAGVMLDKFRRNMDLDDIKNEVYLINDNGYWVASENEYKQLDVRYYEISYDSGVLPPEKWNSVKEQKHHITESGMYTLDEIDFSNNPDTADEANQNEIVFRETNCKIAALVKSGTDKDYYIYNDLSLTLRKMFSERFTYFIGGFLVAALVAFLILKNKSNLERMRYSSHYDSLTKVYNRRQGLNKLEDAVNNIGYYRKICICFIDIDGLKEVNDNLGHCFGDELIITVTNTILNMLREDDIVIRMGGDEFIIVLKRVGKAIAETIWTRIEAAFKAINSMEDRKYIISASHGIVEIGAGSQKIDINAAITEADDKMYAEKIRVKNTLNIIRRKY